MHIQLLVFLWLVLKDVVLEAGSKHLEVTFPIFSGRLKSMSLWSLMKLRSHHLCKRIFLFFYRVNR